MERTILFVLFFVSGFSSLVYEVVWSRMLVLVFGNTTLATSIILSSFMAGLSLGSWLWGRFAARCKTGPLFLFGCLEISTGLYALLFPFLLRAVTPIEVWLSGPLTPGYYPLVLMRGLLCFSLIVLPTFLMGGTFAVLGKHLIQDENRFARDAALLYGLNTAGAVLGAGLTGFFLIRTLGNSGSYTLAAAFNLLIGLSALLIGRGAERPGHGIRRPSSDLRSPDPSRSQAGGMLLFLGVGISGFCGLCYEVLWTRLLLLVVDNSVYSFTVILVGFLLGISVGSLLLAPLMRALSDPVPAFGLAQMGIGVAAYLFPFTIQVESVQGNVHYYAFLIQGVLFMVLLTSLLMGMSLPLAVEIYRRKEREVSVTIGNLYALNTIGGVLGALAGGFVLIPLLGMLKSSLLLNAMNWVTGGAFVFLAFRGVERAGFSAALVVLLLLGVWIAPGDLVQKKYASLVPQGRMVFYKEGIAATAAVFDQPDGERILFLNGTPEVRNDKTSLRTFKMMGALPCLLHRAPVQGLTITFGAGITSGTMVRLVERLDCVEIVEEAREIARLFAVENGGVLENRKVTLHINDARHYLLSTPKKYDVIVADATHPRGYDSWILFTREFYDLVKGRLEADGIFTQWVPLHGLNLDQFMAVVRTFFSVFPGASLWVVDQSYSLLMGGAEPGKMDFGRLAERMSRQEVKNDLRGVGLESPPKLVSHFVAGEQGIRRMLDGFPNVVTDDSPRHLFFPPGATFGEQYGQWPEENYNHLVRFEESILPYLTNLGEDEERIKSNTAAIRVHRRKSN